MGKLKSLDWVALILVIVGGLNWGLVGIWKFDLVAYILGSVGWLQNLVYILVALSALYLALVAKKLARS